MPQIPPAVPQNQDSQPQPTLPHLLSATPPCLLSPLLLQHLPPGLQKKRKGKKTAAELSSFGLQILVCKAEPDAAPQVRGYLAHCLVLLGLETPLDSPAWVGGGAEGLFCPVTQQLGPKGPGAPLEGAEHPPHILSPSRNPSGRAQHPLHTLSPSRNPSGGAQHPPHSPSPAKSLSPAKLHTLQGHFALPQEITRPFPQLRAQFIPPHSTFWCMNTQCGVPMPSSRGHPSLLSCI